MDIFPHRGIFLILTPRFCWSLPISLEEEVKRAGEEAKWLEPHRCRCVDSYRPPQGLIFWVPPCFFWWSSGCKQVPLAHLWYFYIFFTLYFFLDWVFMPIWKNYQLFSCGPLGASARSSGLHRCPQSSWCQKGPGKTSHHCFNFQESVWRPFVYWSDRYDMIWYDMIWYDVSHWY